MPLLLDFLTYKWKFYNSGAEIILQTQNFVIDIEKEK